MLDKQQLVLHNLKQCRQTSVNYELTLKSSRLEPFHRRADSTLAASLTTTSTTPRLHDSTTPLSRLEVCKIFGGLVSFVLGQKGLRNTVAREETEYGYRNVYDNRVHRETFEECLQTLLPQALTKTTTTPIMKKEDLKVLLRDKNLFGGSSKENLTSSNLWRRCRAPQR